MMERSAAEAFARVWIAAWNAHDLPAILAHYADNVVFHSPRIAAVLGGSAASVSGKPALSDYWSRALEITPELKFELSSVLVGSDALTILYRNQRGEDVAETLMFEGGDDQVTRGVATYR
jgi:ketosteroid isomerase-like protein